MPLAVNSRTALTLPAPLYTWTFKIKYTCIFVQITCANTVVDKWSACSTSILTILVQIPLKPTVFFLKFVLEKTENKQKRGRGFFSSRGNELCFEAWRRTVIFLCKIKKTLPLYLSFYLVETDQSIFNLTHFGVLTTRYLIMLKE